MDAQVQMLALAGGFGGMTRAKNSKLFSGGEGVTNICTHAGETKMAIDDRNGRSINLA